VTHCYIDNVQPEPLYTQPPLKRALRAAFMQLGGLQFARWLNRKRLRILMYHRFHSAKGLEMQCRHLRKHYHTISLTEAATRMQAGDPLPPNSLVITIDDGYRDFATVAHPIFAAYQLPVTIYVVTEFLDGARWLWIDQVRYAFRHTRRPEFHMDLPGAAPLYFTLSTDEQRRHAARQLCETLKLIRNADRLAALSCVPQLLDVRIPPQPPEGQEPLSWDDARILASQGVDFGAHTLTHPILSRLPAAELAPEISGSKQRLEQMLNAPVRHFCYPNGTARDFTPETVRAVRQAGYQTAVTTIPGINSPGDDLFLLRRIPVDPLYGMDYFPQLAAALRV